MKNYFVYSLIDPRNSLPFYIGKGLVIDNHNRRYRRIQDHLSLSDTCNPFKTAVIKKISDSGLSVAFEIIEEDLLEEESLGLEITLILHYGRRSNGSGILTNLTDGGDGVSGCIRSSETKAKMSAIRKEWTRQNGAPFKGCKHTMESRSRMSISQKLYRAKTGKVSFKGCKHTEEAKQKMSQARKLQGCSLPKEERYRFGSPGARNVFAKKYVFTSPGGEVFDVIGRFKEFVKEHSLSVIACKRFINKGVIPPPKNIAHNRMTQNRINTSGWKIDRIDDI